MNKKKVFLFLTVASLLSFGLVAFASGTIEDEANAYYEKFCIRDNLTGLTAFVCDLRNQVDILNTSLTPEPKTIIFAENRPASFNSEWQDVSGGYNTLSVDVSSTGTIATYAIQFTNDMDGSYTVQTGLVCSSSQCPLLTVPVLAKYYRVSIGTASGDITAIGYLVKN